jgi:tRNA (guanine-N7-)-methyltransferase
MERPTNRSYKLRGTRITQAQEIATEKYWQVFGIDVDANPNPEPIIPGEVFPNSEKIIMEIGTGMGEATAEIAELFPTFGFFAVELHKPGIGSLLARMSEKNLTNIRIVNDDARVIMQYLLPDQSIDAFHLYFPDPWPKNKHWKRRIVQPDFIELIAKKLKSEGYIHIATDWVPYAEWIVNLFSKSELFEGGEIPKPDFRPLTKFEGQGLRKGHKVTDLKFVKC